MQQMSANGCRKQCSITIFCLCFWSWKQWFWKIVVCSVTEFGFATCNYVLGTRRGRDLGALLWPVLTTKSGRDKHPKQMMGGGSLMNTGWTCLQKYHCVVILFAYQQKWAYGLGGDIWESNKNKIYRSKSQTREGQCPSIFVLWIFKGVFGQFLWYLILECCNKSDFLKTTFYWFIIKRLSYGRTQL